MYRRPCSVDVTCVRSSVNDVSYTQRGMCLICTLQCVYTCRGLYRMVWARGIVSVRSAAEEPSKTASAGATPGGQQVSDHTETHDIAMTYVCGVQWVFPCRIPSAHRPRPTGRRPICAKDTVYTSPLKHCKSHMKSRAAGRPSSFVLKPLPIHISLYTHRESHQETRARQDEPAQGSIQSSLAAEVATVASESSHLAALEPGAAPPGPVPWVRSTFSR